MLHKILHRFRNSSQAPLTTSLASWLVALSSDQGEKYPNIEEATSKAGYLINHTQ